MKKGLDTNVNMTKFAAAIRSQGYDFVCRYYNVNNPLKNLTLGEAHVLSAAGLGIVVVWENGLPTSSGYFNYARGVHDGTCAYHYAQQEITQPAATPIYFSVDYDASAADVQACILPYFEGLKAGFNTISQNSPIYPIGVYGSGLVCTSVLKSGIAGFSWLAQSMGYEGSREFQASGKGNIVQLPCTEFKSAVGNFSIDTDESPGNNEGSFTIKVAAIS
jgi:hypothetical protein